MGFEVFDTKFDGRSIVVTVERAEHRYSTPAIEFHVIFLQQTRFASIFMFVSILNIQAEFCVLCKYIPVYICIRVSS